MLPLSSSLFPGLSEPKHAQQTHKTHLAITAEAAGLKSACKHVAVPCWILAHVLQQKTGRQAGRHQAAKDRGL